MVGNTVGGLLAGTFIRRTGRYKALLVIGGLVAAITHVLMLIRWNGHTNFGESLYIIPGGMGTGIASASAFVAMTALLEPQDMAMATGGYMLIVSFAMTTGITMTNTVLGLGFKHQLEQNLHGKGAEKVRELVGNDWTACVLTIVDHSSCDVGYELHCQTRGKHLGDCCGLLRGWLEEYLR